MSSEKHADRHVHASDAYLALQRAREKWEPACAGDSRFTDDDADRSELYEICATKCRIRTQCNAYAERARPPAGIWAGHFYTPLEPRDETA
ncbi:WhiB family transcriptional regulator [Microbacterium sp. NPDC078428]|uniref:WhiB family transcriptional regulator n=1 Tax=Microbacterium sp. NPDC078428 TaxID=3364190 RepID=UPI0037C9E0D1